MQTEQAVTTETSPVAPESLAQVWRTNLKMWGKAFLVVLFPFLITRLALLLLTYFAVISSNLPTNSTFALQPQTVIYSWYHWDVTRILTIATTGYQKPVDTAYFPLYPALIQVVGKVLHLDLLLAGMLVANLAFLLALAVLYRLVSMEFDAATAQRSTLYLAIFPTALLTFAASPLSLFLLFLLLCLYALRRGHWWLAGIFGMQAALTDAAGILLCIIFICEYIRQRFIAVKGPEDEKPETGLLRRWFSFSAVLLILAGTALYAYVLKRQFGKPWTFLYLQDGSNRLTLPWRALIDLFHNVSAGSFFTFAAAHSMFELLLLAIFLMVIILSYVGAERLRGDQWPLALCSVLFFGYTLTLPVMPGLVRNTLDPLPAIQWTFLMAVMTIVVLAKLGRRSWFHQAFLMIMLPLYSFLVIQLVTNHWG